MSIVAPDQKKTWVAVAAAVALVIAAVTAIVLVDVPGERLLGRLSGGETATKVRDLPQAAWRFSVHASGLAGNLTHRQQIALQRQRPRLRSLVKRVYDSLFVHPNRLPATLKENFSEPAARALRRAKPGAAAPARASTTMRRARIGVRAPGGARMAVASVAVRALAEGGAPPVLHRSTLWLERSRGRWKVVAFEVRQARTRDKPDGGRKTPAKRPEGKRR